MSTRRLAIAKRVSLEGLGPNWGDDCYALMMPASYEDMAAADQIDSKSKDEQVRFQIEFLKNHFVSGKVRVIDGKGNDLVDMEPDDVSASVALSDRLFLACLGDDLDPKEARQAAAATKKPKNDVKPTGTPSSMESTPSPDDTPEK
jgi:hypothetical protein